MFKRILLIITTLIIVLSTLIVPASALQSKYNIDISFDDATTSKTLYVDSYDTVYLTFSYNGHTLTWNDFYKNQDMYIQSEGSRADGYVDAPTMSYYHINDINIEYPYLNSNSSLKINWSGLYSSFSNFVPSNLENDVQIYLRGTTAKRNVTFTIVGYSDIEDTLPDDDNDDNDNTNSGSGFDDDDKSWFSSIIDRLVERIEDILNPAEIFNSIKNFWDSIFDIFKSYINFDFQPFYNFLDSISDDSVISYIMRLWEFPIIKDLVYGTLLLAVLYGFFNLLKTL